MSHRVKQIDIEEYNYPLPNERIAKYPLAERDSSKLLHRKDGEIKTAIYRDLDQLLPENAHLIFNKTRVVQARLLFPRQQGKPIEVFCLEPAGDFSLEEAMQAVGSLKYRCLVGGAKKWKTGPLEIALDEVQLKVEMLERMEAEFILEFTWSGHHSFAELLEILGKTPLPPYLKREAEESDRNRYQTVYAERNGSVAAPTAGLHFTPDLLQRLSARDVAQDFLTLHVGAGTFKAVSSDALGEHDMHTEEFFVEGAFVEMLLREYGHAEFTCVGTTSMRALESMYWLGCLCLEKPQISPSALLVGQWVGYEQLQEVAVPNALRALLDYMQREGSDFLRARTQIIIAPSYRFRLCGALLTNFHQPKSTLLLLIAAILGEEWRSVYRYALENDYRFLSYGDGSYFRIQV